MLVGVGEDALDHSMLIIIITIMIEEEP